MRDCAKCGELNVMVAKQTDDDDETGRVGAIQMLNAMRAQSHVCGKSYFKGLMVVTGLINGKETKAFVDSGATHNFISDRVVQNLGLDVKPCDSDEGCEFQSCTNKWSRQHGIENKTMA
ncbi:hypothetical protein Salat_2121300 [Sesamum alatum]|uniref:Uncharacterized protein n=1 Tax=Sesamum alatum TaxID=300844 RepID=A0AAE1Y1U2_9LAMI|nr:hypothetical protein Salat_2121300 [Sesamum alatum]